MNLSIDIINSINLPCVAPACAPIVLSSCLIMRGIMASVVGNKSRSRFAVLAQRFTVMVRVLYISILLI